MATVNLPQALTGDFYWHRQDYPLHPGKQAIELP
jgi:hypothetical protein